MTTDNCDRGGGEGIGEGMANERDAGHLKAMCTHALRSPWTPTTQDIFLLRNRAYTSLEHISEGLVEKIRLLGA